MTLPLLWYKLHTLLSVPLFERVIRGPWVKVRRIPSFDLQDSIRWITLDYRPVTRTYLFARFRNPCQVLQQVEINATVRLTAGQNLHFHYCEQGQLDQLEEVLNVAYLQASRDALEWLLEQVEREVSEAAPEGEAGEP